MTHQTACLQFTVYPFPDTRGFVALGGKSGQALGRDGFVRFDASLRACFFLSRQAAEDAVRLYEQSGETVMHPDMVQDRYDGTWSLPTAKA